MHEKIEIPGVSWNELAEVQSCDMGVLVAVRTEAGRYYRSTSFELTTEEARNLAAALVRVADDRDAQDPV